MPAKSRSILLFVCFVLILPCLFLSYRGPISFAIWRFILRDSVGGEAVHFSYVIPLPWLQRIWELRVYFQPTLLSTYRCFSQHCHQPASSLAGNKMGNSHAIPCSIVERWWRTSLRSQQFASDPHLQNVETNEFEKCVPCAFRLLLFLHFLLVLLAVWNMGPVWWIFSHRGDHRLESMAFYAFTQFFFKCKGRNCANV